MSKNKDKRPTIRHVAREAGISYDTVSRVINNQPDVAPDTRARVQRVIEKMGYQRNLGTQMLITQQSNIIEIIVMDVYFGIVLPRMGKFINEAGYSTLYSECTLETFAATLDKTAARLVKGIILYAPKLHIPDDQPLAMSHGIPTVRRDYVLDSKLTWVEFLTMYRLSVSMMLLLRFLFHRLRRYVSTLTCKTNWHRSCCLNRLINQYTHHQHVLIPDLIVRNSVQALT